MGKPKLVDAAPAAMPRKRGPGGPWVTVRAQYGALPSVAGRDRRRGGESLPGWRACSRLPPAERSPGRKRRRGGALSGVAVCRGFSAIREISRGRYQGAPFGVPSPLKKGRSTKSPTRAAARERKRLAV